jgi:hypothetical protein
MVVGTRTSPQNFALAERVSRNVPLRRDPERFHVEKSCIAQDPEHLASHLDERSSAQITNRRVFAKTARRTGLALLAPRF